MQYIRGGNILRLDVASFKYALALALISSLAFGVFFSISEPVISRAATDEFIVTSTVTDEVSFTVPASDVSLSPSIPGLTGGTATGTTDVAVTTNSASGYTLDISFSTTTAMQGNVTSGVINNYSPSVVGVPDYNFTIGGSGTPGEFAFTVETAEAAATSGLDASFLDSGAACNTGSNMTSDQCWLNPSTTDERIISRTSVTSSGGATTTLDFRVTLPSSPNPVVPGDTYTATATLTALVQ